jgi:hypothetical protein
MNRPGIRRRVFRPFTKSPRGIESLEPRAMLDGDGGSGGAMPLLPDLIPLADEAKGYIYDWSVNAVNGGRTLLRLSTATANIGAGPLELIGSATHPDGTQDVIQRVYQSDDSYVDRLAGDFIYHPEHDHIHFEGYAEYNLRAVTENEGVGDVVATGGKTSFCLIDLDQHDLTLPAAPSASQYNECGTTQGLSVGWEDIYDRSLPDQWIDVTGVAEGPYWLEVVADPDNHIEELDDTNNTTRILIDLVAPEPLEPDSLEPNNTRATAAQLGPGSVQVENLSIHESGNDDWFAWTAAETGSTEFVIHFNGEDGDLDLFVYDATGRLLDSSQGVDNSESVTLSVAASATVFVKVEGYDGAVNADYTLSIDAGGSLILPDALEPNNSLNFPTHLDPVAQAVTELSIHAALDVDYFRWTAPAAGQLRLVADVGDEGGEVELQLFNMLRQEIASTAGGDFEEIVYDLQPGALVFFGVHGAHGHAVPNYTLLVEYTALQPGDVNGDNAVNLADLNLVRNHFGESGEHVPGDTDFDGDVDLADLNSVRNHFGASLPTPVVQARSRQSPSNHRAERSNADALARIETTSLPANARLKAIHRFAHLVGQALSPKK